MAVIGRGERVSFSQRMEDIRTRYGSGSLFVESLNEGGEERLERLSEEIENKIKQGP